MSTDTTDTVDTEPGTGPDDPDTGPDTTDSPPDTVARAELDKAVARRDKALQTARDLKAQLAELQNKDTDKDKPDPVALANQRIVRAEARTMLATVAGVTDKKDQATVLEMLSLDGIEVDDTGEVDTDALEERVTELRRIFGGPEPVKRKVSARVDTRDRAGSGTGSADPDAERYRRIRAGR